MRRGCFWVWKSDGMDSLDRRGSPLRRTASASMAFQLGTPPGGKEAIKDIHDARIECMWHFSSLFVTMSSASQTPTASSYTSLSSNFNP